MRGKPFQLGNTLGKGRPPGARNKKTIWEESFQLHGMQAISQLKLVSFRPNPSIAALLFYVGRLIPPPKPPNSRFPLPRVRTAADLPKALSAVTRAVAAGQLSTQEGLAMVQMIEAHRRMFEVGDFDQRVRALEEGGQKIPLLPIEPILGKPVEPIEPILDKPVEPIDPSPGKEGEDS
jgi:hypothetical protein